MSPPPAPREAEVVYLLKQHLERNGLGSEPVSGVLVDADASYLQSERARALQPMAVVRVGGYRPDLLCPSTPQALWQCLYHVGIVATRMHRSAGRSASVYLPAGDIWELDGRLVPGT